MDYITLGIIASVAIFLYLAFREYFSAGRGGFHDWVTNPDYRKAASDYFAARAALVIPDDISESEIRGMVERLFVEKDQDFNKERLKLVGIKALPFLIEALEDPQTAVKMFSKDGHAFAEKSPFERICNILEPLAPPSAVGALSRYIVHDNEHFRVYAALAMANIGTAECIPHTLKSLTDQNPQVCTFGMYGIHRGITAQRSEKAFLDAVFPTLIELLTRDDLSTTRTAPELLLAIDRERATEILISSANLAVDNNRSEYNLLALNNAKVKIPHERLLPFLNTVKPLIGKYPHSYEYSAALVSYAINPDSKAQEVIQSELNSTEEVVRRGAGEAIAILHGVLDAYGYALNRMDDLGFDDLSSPLKLYLAVRIYDSEVNNGGHTQFFSNSSGGHWMEALKGLKEMGAHERAKVLEEAIKLFGASGPSRNDENRHKELAKLVSRHRKLFESLDDRYYSCTEDVNVLLAKFAVQNKQHFMKNGTT
ncbi:hypothetical protein Plim_0140 [Planctopirus limnophila DSM 3776]|uniref:DNA mimic protein DMP19 C-terminal domain-containing protein n=1 Tax=Planctopirus limnophila (strain ATCC 43296 / DSM 3776 / IFAM 1008 / Mu 290) TaxID=521674 RepID=D5SN65_PLAL2|nr:DUF4375 domain-containing protein [Planctopirus limnophila]ADG65992.1 hypothetical protein Plim_0140 [Planctopirus limnophila DSM 3776]